MIVVGDLVDVSAAGQKENYAGVGRVTAVEKYWVTVIPVHPTNVNWNTEWVFSHARVTKARAFSAPVPQPIIDFGERVRFRDEETGYEKDASQYRFDLIPRDALAELAKVYGVGEAKYPSGPEGPNWLQGGPYWPSQAALDRHFAAWSLGEDVDPSDNTYHLAKVAWHAFALLTYELRGLGRDTRAKKRVA